VYCSGGLSAQIDTYPIAIFNYRSIIYHLLEVNMLQKNYNQNVLELFSN